jgi:hypothetical protein
MPRRLTIIAALCVAALLCAAASAQNLTVPGSATAGEDLSISTNGSGSATFYLLGPGVSLKNEVELGEEIRLRSQDLKTAGQYLAILCSGTCQSSTLYVTAAKPFNLTFLVHPSRVPVALNDAVSGAAFVFDQYHNLILAPQSIDFHLSSGNNSLFSRTERTQNGAAWFRTASSKSAGLLQVMASLGDISTVRAVQQVASDPCNLRITGQRNAEGILVQTEPVHDCGGNPVPDGTIVTFTVSGANGKDTVDAPIKHGIARAQMAASGTAVISAASGVVTGNELRMGGH